MHTLETGLPSEGNSHSGDIVHHVQQHFQFRFQLRHYSLQPYQKPQARQLRQPEQNIQVLPVLIYTFMELRVGISQAAIEQWGSSASLSGYVAVCIFPISFTTTDYTAVATGVMSAADATFGKENYVNNILWDFTSESQVAFRLSHLDRPTLRYIAIGF